MGVFGFFPVFLLFFFSLTTAGVMRMTLTRARRSHPSEDWSVELGPEFESRLSGGDCCRSAPLAPVI